LFPPSACARRLSFTRDFSKISEPISAKLSRQMADGLDSAGIENVFPTSEICRVVRLWGANNINILSKCRAGLVTKELTYARSCAWRSTHSIAILEMLDRLVLILYNTFEIHLQKDITYSK